MLSASGLGAEVGVPGIESRIEAQHSHLAVITAQGPQQRQGDGVVTADGEQFRSIGPELVRRRLDLPDGLVEVEGSIATSPASATWCGPKGSVSAAGFYVRSSSEQARTWPGPKRLRDGRTPRSRRASRPPLRPPWPRRRCGAVGRRSQARRAASSSSHHWPADGKTVHRQPVSCEFRLTLRCARRGRPR